MYVTVFSAILCFIMLEDVPFSLTFCVIFSKHRITVLIWSLIWRNRYARRQFWTRSHSRQRTATGVLGMARVQAGKYRVGWSLESRQYAHANHLSFREVHSRIEKNTVNKFRGQSPTSDIKTPIFSSKVFIIKIFFVKSFYQQKFCFVKNYFRKILLVKNAFVKNNDWRKKLLTKKPMSILTVSFLQ